MKIVLQRVSDASVKVEGKIIGVNETDDQQDAD